VAKKKTTVRHSCRTATVYTPLPLLAHHSESLSHNGCTCRLGQDSSLQGALEAERAKTCQHSSCIGRKQWCVLLLLLPTVAYSTGTQCLSPQHAAPQYHISAAAAAAPLSSFLQLHAPLHSHTNTAARRISLRQERPSGCSTSRCSYPSITSASTAVAASRCSLALHALCCAALEAGVVPGRHLMGHRAHCTLACVRARIMCCSSSATQQHATAAATQ
jgi:hypothetical protein